MGTRDFDLLVINPSALRSIYQTLSSQYAAIETPIWAGLITNFAREKNFSTQLIDCEGEGLNVETAYERYAQYNPKLVVVVVYGQQPSASTQNMHGASQIVTKIKQENPDQKILLMGGHISALPQQTLDEEACDFVCQGEGPATIEGLLSIDMDNPMQLRTVPSLWFKDGNRTYKTDAAANIPQVDLDITLPGVAYDMLPMENYRAHNWHCFDHIDQRQPYASIYTSLGCPYKCSFCCINAPFGGSSFRYWSPEFIAGQFDILVKQYGVRNIKIADEMFVLNEKHFLKLCELLIQRKYDLNIWAYARVDTVKPKYLDILREAGVRWLVLGIESKSKFVRDGMAKGRFDEEAIPKTVKMIQDHGINVHGNYIFGLPDDNFDTMNETLQMAIELNCEMSNFYSAMAYPGSQLYNMAVENKWALPENWLGYSQHSKNCLPLPTKYLKAEEVLGFRDAAWNKYFTGERYLSMLERKFGIGTRQHIEELTKHTLQRDNAVPYNFMS